ncbi:MAG TPA: hypothetical protein VHN77_15770 [Phycisphaerales bacterium]|nr:hypothetical protein [Phycisphaerales bacterium]
MSLTEVMSAAGLTFYPIVALVLFLFAFALVLARLVGSQSAHTYERYAHLPLEEDKSASSNEPAAMPVHNTPAPVRHGDAP